MTISIEQAKKLHELGVRRKPLKYWGVMNEDHRGEPRIVDGWADLGIYDVVYPAYSAEELIKLLRAKEHIPIDIYSHGDGFMFHQEGSFVAGEDDIYGATLTEALGNKLIYDLENGIVSVEEVNK